MIGRDLIYPETTLRDAYEVKEVALEVLNRGHSNDKLEGLIYRHYKNNFITQIVLQNPQLQFRISEIQQSMQAYERGFEKKYTQEFIEESTLKAEEYVEHYRGMVEREGKMVGLRPHHKILILGGGALPLTALSFSRVFDPQITCIDIDMKAIEISTHLVKHLGLQKNIDIKYGDGNKYPMSGYDMILATCSMPKSKSLFGHIFNERKTAKVICRDPLGLYKLWYQETNPKDISDYKIIKSEESNKQWAAKSTLIVAK